MATVHVPILVNPIVDALLEPFHLLPRTSEVHWLVDCTLGGGGHTGHLLEAMSLDPRLSRHKILGVDQDEEAIQRAKIRFSKEIEEGRLELWHGPFGDLAPIIQGRFVLGILADLGFSSDQIEDPERGLSFSLDGPLDMRMDSSRGKKCREILSQISELDLAKAIEELGEDRFAQPIARSIIHYRRQNGVPKTTHELAEVISAAVPPKFRHGKLHPATRTFQALRIMVNQELDELDSLLSRVIIELVPGGRAAIMSFHSLEDRRVKTVFKDADSGFKSLTKKPIVADDEEIGKNPRARSAKLRIAEKCHED